MRRSSAATSLRPKPAALWWVIIAGATAIPLTVLARATDPFRIPKEIEFRAVGILVIAAAVAVGWNEWRQRRWRPEVALASAACGWAIISALFAVNRTLSADALVTIICSAAIFLAVCTMSKDRSEKNLLWIIGPALVNAAVIIAQTSGLWNPFRSGFDPLPDGGLIGNRNDAASYLFAPALASVAMMIVSRGLQRWLYGVSAVAILAGLVASQTISAIVGYAVAIAAFLLIGKRHVLLPVAATILIVALAASLALRLDSPTVRKITMPIEYKFTSLLGGNLDLATSHRVGASLAAWEMFKHRPLTGVGPGDYRFEFFDNAIEVERRYPTVVSPYAARLNFSEAHNDHLQVLAETGIVGYIIFAGALVFLASIGIRSGTSDLDHDPRASFARALALPLASGFAVMAVAQFPLELAAPRMTLIILSAMCCGWSRVQ